MSSWSLLHRGKKSVEQIIIHLVNIVKNKFRNVTTPLLHIWILFCWMNLQFNDFLPLCLKLEIRGRWVLYSKILVIIECRRKSEFSSLSVNGHKWEYLKTSLAQVPGLFQVWWVGTLAWSSLLLGYECVCQIPVTQSISAQSGFALNGLPQALYCSLALSVLFQREPEHLTAIFW